MIKPQPSGVLTLLTILGSLVAPVPAAGASYNFATGPVNGTYHQLVLRSLKILQSSSLAREEAIVAVATQGSQDNVERLVGGEVQLALAQQDVVVDYLSRNGTKPFPPEGKVQLAHQDAAVDHVNRNGTKPFSVVGRVFFDYLHILVRNPLRIETTSDFRQLRVWPGSARSGTRVTATWFLDNVGIPVWSLTGPRGQETLPNDLTFAEVHKLLTSDQLDVAMLMITPDNAELCEKIRAGEYSLFSLDYRTRRLLTEERRELQPRQQEEGNSTSSPTRVYRRQVALASIPPKTYGQRNPVPTVAVSVLLLVSPEVEAATASRVLNALQAAWLDLQKESEASASTCPIPAIKPSVDPIADSGLPPVGGLDWPDERTLHGYGPAVTLVLIVTVLSLAIWLKERGWIFRLRKLLQGRLVVVLTAVFLLGIPLITFGTWAFEHKINEHFSSPQESLWSITVYLFSGLEDRTPYTTPGRFTAALGLLLGPLLFAAGTGWLARIFIRWEKHMPGNLKDHYLILNWSDRGTEIIRQLHHPVITAREGNAVVVVLSDDSDLDIKRLKESGVGADGVFEDFFLSIGDPTAERALLNANAQDTRAILILSHAENGNHSDERTIRSLVMLRRIARHKGERQLHVVAEVVNPANSVIIDEIAADFPGVVETVSGLEVETCLLAQATLGSGITDFYGDLLRVSGDTNEVYVRPVPTSAVGMSFREYAGLVLQAHLEEPLIAVGVQRTLNGRLRTFPNPRPGTPGSVLEEGDHLIFLAYEPPPKDALPAP